MSAKTNGCLDGEMDKRISGLMVGWTASTFSTYLQAARRCAPVWWAEWPPGWRARSEAFQRRRRRSNPPGRSVQRHSPRKCPPRETSAAARGIRARSHENTPTRPIPTRNTSPSRQEREPGNNPPKLEGKRTRRGCAGTAWGAPADWRRSAHAEPWTSPAERPLARRPSPRSPPAPRHPRGSLRSGAADCLLPCCGPAPNSASGLVLRPCRYPWLQPRTTRCGAAACGCWFPPRRIPTRWPRQRPRGAAGRPRAGLSASLEKALQTSRLLAAGRTRSRPELLFWREHRGETPTRARQTSSHNQWGGHGDRGRSRCIARTANATLQRTQLARRRRSRANCGSRSPAAPLRLD